MDPAQHANAGAFARDQGTVAAMCKRPELGSLNAPGIYPFVVHDLSQLLECVACVSLRRSYGLELLVVAFP